MTTTMRQGIVYCVYVFDFAMTDEQVRASFEVTKEHPYQLPRDVFWSLVLERLEKQPCSD